MKERVIQYLSCPACKADIELLKSNSCDSTGHIIEGKLQCTSCKAIYPIIKGVPCFSLSLKDKTVDQNRKNFGDEWNYFTNTIDEGLAKNELDSYFHPFVDYKDLDSKTILDAGCGGGRLCYIVSKKTKAKEIIGVDLSSAVFTAFKNTKHLDNATIIQADINKLPFKKSFTFDFIYSVGVLHHLPNPKHGFTSLTKNLRENGELLVWVYGKEGNFLYITFADPLRKYITSKLPFKVNLLLSFLISVIVWLIIRLIYFPVNKVLGLNNTNKILPMNEYFDYFRKRGFKDFWRTVFDKMVPTISYYISKDEFEDWFKTNSLQFKTYFRNGHSWTGIGLKRDSMVSLKVN
ncbi:MAG: methyltransferase domain-containing protein [Candidatus Melainabacteria bacterium]|nr:methyltransferase domain-containing protein [Candidatus Melainabacteria bacterium]